MSLQVTVFGSLQVTLDGNSIKNFRSSKVKALLIYLICTSGRLHTREMLADLFWPDQNQKKASNNLRQTLTRLQKTINNSEANPPYILLSQKRVQFNLASDHQLDLYEFQYRLSSCKRHQNRYSPTCQICLSGLKKAAALYTADLLPQFSISDAPSFDHWLQTMREETRQQGKLAYQRLADQHEKRGEYDLADQYASKLLMLSPWDEHAYRSRMRIWARQGRRTDALKLYKSLDSQLKRELGDDVDPEPETQTLYAKIKSSSKKRLHNLPSLFGQKFVGRREEIAHIKYLLSSPDCRMLTITGLGGMGKTELSLQVSWSVINDRFGPFIDGVFMIDIPQGQRNAVTIVTQLANALDIKLTSQRQIEKQLLQRLATKECLLFLDNGENLEEDGRQFLTTLLQKTKSIKLLAASRHRLNIRGETQFPLQGLPFPQINDSYSDSFAAINCFIGRATQIDATFQLDRSAQKAVAKITQLTEGLPLALRLAASWVQVFSCDDIAHKIEQSIKNLKAIMDDGDQRHRSMWAIFDQSWELIGDELRKKLAKLSVFEGGFSAEAAIEITAVSPIDLANLANYSLVEKRQSSSATTLRLHPLLRQYLHEKEPLDTQTREIHSAYYGDQLEALIIKLDSERLHDAYNGMDHIWSNVQASWSWLIFQADLPEIGRYAKSLHDLLTVRGWSMNGAMMLQQSAHLLPVKNQWRHIDHNDMLLWASIMARLGNFLTDIGQLAKAEHVLEQSLWLAGQVEDSETLSFVYNRITSLLVKRGDWQKAKQIIANSQSMVNSESLFAKGSHHMLNGAIEFHVGNYHSAQQLFSDSLHLFNQENVFWATGHARRWLAATELQLKNYQKSKQLLTECAKTHSENNDWLGYSLAQHQTGKFFRAQADTASALEALHDGLTSAQKIEYETGQLMIEIELAGAYLQSGLVKNAQAYLASALERALVLEQPPLLLETLSLFVQWIVLGENEIDGRINKLIIMILNHKNGTYAMRQNLHSFLNANEIKADGNRIQNLSLQEIKQLTEPYLFTNAIGGI